MTRCFTARVDEIAGDRVVIHCLGTSECELFLLCWHGKSPPVVHVPGIGFERSGLTLLDTVWMHLVFVVELLFRSR